MALATLNINPVVLAITGAIVVITGAIALFDHLNVTLEENQQKLSEIQNEYGEAKTSFENVEKSLANIRDRIKEINEQDSVSITDQNELDLLLLEEQRLQAIYETKKLIAEQAQIDLEKQASKTIRASVDNPYSGQNIDYTTGEITYNQTDRVQLIKDATSEMEEQLDVLNDLNSSEAERANAQIDYDKAKTLALGYTDALISETEGLDKTGEMYTYVMEAINGFTRATREQAETEDNASNSTAENIVSLEGLQQQLEESTSSYEDAKSKLSAMEDSFNSLNSAVDEYNSTGQFSLSTIDNLLNLGSEYISLLQFENGQVSINEQGALALANANLDLAQSKALANAQSEIEVLIGRDVIAQNNNIAQSGNNVASGLAVAQEAMYLLGLQASEAIPALVGFNKATAGSQDETTVGINKITTATLANIQAIESIRSNLGSYTNAVGSSSGGGSGATGATNDFTDALKEQKKALEDQVDTYEIVIDYIKDKIKEEQESVEDEKDAVLDAIKEKIEALEKEKDAFNENLDEQIEAIKEKQEIEEEYWDSLIDKVNADNDVIEENIRLQELQENVAKEKSNLRLVLKDGKWDYVASEQGVSDAQNELAEYERELAVEKHIAELEKLKEDALNSLEAQLEQLEEYVENTNKEYDKQLEDLQSHYDDVEAEYDLRIEQYDDYLQQFEDMLSASADAHAEILAKELLGEQSNWSDRLVALGAFVAEYENKKNQILALQAQIDSAGSGTSSRGGTPSTGGGGGNTTPAVADKWRVVGNDGRVIDEGFSSRAEALAYARTIGAFNTTVEKYAKGTPYVKEDQVAFIGDDPEKREIVIGSKLNGVPTNLQKGSGVIPAKETNTLTSMLTNLARGASYSNVENTSKSTSISIGHITLPNVQNGNDFVDYLMNFETNMVQKSY